MPTFRAALKTISSLSTITKTRTPSLRIYHTSIRMGMCRIGHRSVARKSSITSMHPLPVLFRMPKMRSLCLTMKSSSTTLKRRSFLPTSLGSATSIVNFSRSTKRLIILLCSTCTRQLSPTKKSSSQSITTRLITCRNVTKSSRDSPILNPL